MSELVVCVEQGMDLEAAFALAKRVGATVSDTPGEELTFLMTEDGISLMGYGLCYRGDFEQMLHRIEKGRLQHEMLARVVKTKEDHPTAIDATAGMGEDALLLAACGYEVTMYEQNPVIAVLLEDAMKRAQNHPVLGELLGRMHLVEANSIEQMRCLSEAPDIIYLDPMFPTRQKSGLIRKKLQLIQRLEQPCIEEEQLLEAAIAAHPRKIIIKRPLKGALLAGRNPNYSIRGKAIRYDCLFFP